MTGGATGIGAAIRNRLHAAGHELIVVDVKDADVIANLGTAEGRRAALEAIRARAADGLDGFVPCAGVAGHVPDRALIPSLNFFGTVELLEGLKDLLALRKGVVVLVSSNSAPMPTSDDYVNALLAGDEAKARELAAAMPQGHPAYSGSKQALARWMRRNTRDYAAAGIRMNAIAPGYTATPMTAAVEADPATRDAIRAFLASTPVGRAGQPEDQADATMFLLSPAASFICGSVLFVDGGFDAMSRPDAI
jgi:NAD(P)-dependent dehydrogenase (short-subunit alcohol dehydrogenase family)